MIRFLAGSRREPGSQGCVRERNTVDYFAHFQSLHNSIIQSQVAGSRRANQDRRAAFVNANTELIASLAFARSARIALWSSPTSSSLSDEKHVAYSSSARRGAIRCLLPNTRPRRPYLQRFAAPYLMLGAYWAAQRRHHQHQRAHGADRDHGPLALGLYQTQNDHAE